MKIKYIIEKIINVKLSAILLSTGNRIMLIIILTVLTGKDSGKRVISVQSSKIQSPIPCIDEQIITEATGA
jgi:hypothetical protein